jgi:2,4-diaminopentanoate dehydrogenase
MATGTQGVDEIRAVLFGVGQTARILARYADEKGVRIVGAFSRSTGIGQDAGTVLELGTELGFPVSSDPARDLAGLSADIAILATQSTVASQRTLIELCLDHGLDVVSLAEEGFHPTTSCPGWSTEIDSHARSRAKTVFFGGVQDVFWYDALLALTGGAQRIDAISGRSVADLDDLGSATVADFPLGLPSAQFAQAVSDSQEPESLQALLPAIEALLAALGVEPREVVTRVDPVLADHDVTSRALGSTIAVGTTRGLAEVVTVETDAGFTVEVSFASQIMQPGETESITWNVSGEPDLRMEFPRFPGYEVTAASLINRLPAVLAQEPGYTTVTQLPHPRWWPGARRDEPPR